MDEQVRIEILADDDVVIKYAEVKEDVVSREDVAAYKAQREDLLNKRALIDEQLAELDKKLAFAENIIAIADKVKAEKLAAESQVEEEQSVAQEIVEETTEQVAE